MVAIRLTILLIVSLIFLTAVSPPSIADIELNWRFCRNCKILYWDGDGNEGVCANGGDHVHQKQNFRVYRNEVPKCGEPGWRYCELCRGLFWRERADQTGKCVATGGKHKWGKAEYAVHRTCTGNEHVSAYEKSWAFCKKCGAFFYYGHEDKGNCASRGKHESDYPGYFALNDFSDPDTGPSLRELRNRPKPDPKPDPQPEEKTKKIVIDDPNCLRETSKDGGNITYTAKSLCCVVVYDPAGTSMTFRLSPGQTVLVEAGRVWNYCGQ
jgi:hypothetical protein